MAKRIAIVGYGNWASAIAKVVGENVHKYSEFETTVAMWVKPKMFNGRLLTDIINEDHQNPMYLPNVMLPSNVIAYSCLKDTVKDANILIFVTAHQMVQDVCAQIKGHVHEEAVGISLIKGMVTQSDGTANPISKEISSHLNIDISVLMGANIANDIAAGGFAEATVGCIHPEHGEMFQRMFDSENFRINVVRDVYTVELCGALKNIVACAVGFAEGLGLGSNAKAALIRLGMHEMIKFIETFYPGSDLKTFFESCGLADLIATCEKGRNSRVCKAFVASDKAMHEVEAEELNGQSAQGPPTASEIYGMLRQVGLEESFPIFTIVHRICTRQVPASDLKRCLQNHHLHQTVQSKEDCSSNSSGVSA
uniref:Glycerol-3-phosphate dehydrogenase [NAD(+)] n=1 Tax=Steinernema glaseri TaxID=37863 RepID=A0A1I8ABH0_9BILA